MCGHSYRCRHSARICRGIATCAIPIFKRNIHEQHHLYHWPDRRHHRDPVVFRFAVMNEAAAKIILVGEGLAYP
jgi:hypothetical protein